MRHRRTLLLAIFATVSLAACSSASAGWTYTPGPPATPVPSVEASAGASAEASAGASGAAPSEGASAAPSASAAASGAASAPPSASASAATGGTVDKLTAVGIKFVETAIEAPANAPFQIAFDNQDAGVPHNVSIHQGDPNGAEVFKGEIVTGPVVKTYDIGPLAAGTYAFVCIVHPQQMFGTLTVK
jgi:plastocyanin